MSLSVDSSTAALLPFNAVVLPLLNQTVVLELLSKAAFDTSQIEQSLRQRVLQFCDDTTTLNLVGRQTPKYVQSIASLFKNVQEISVAQAEINEGYFRELSQFSRLKELKVFMSTITCFEAVQYLTQISTLDTLFFSNCEGIDDEALVHMEVFNGLQNLSFITCKKSIEEDGVLDAKLITDTGAEYLTCLPELRSLNLCESFIGDTTLLNVAARLKKLGTLSLSGCASITDAGVQALSCAQTLRSLVVRDCSVSEAVCDDLARQIAGIEVVRA